MISQEQIDLLIERLVERINQANTYFLKSIGSSIKQIKKLTPSQAHQLVQMLKYGGDFNDVLQQIAKYTNMDIKDVDNVFNTYAKQDQRFYEQFYRYRNIPFTPYKDNYVLRNQTEALANIVKNEMYDYFRSNVIGYSIRDNSGKLVFKGLKEVYNQALDEALLNVSQGKETFDSAMSHILNDIGGSGLKTINYTSGRAVRLDSVVKTHLNARISELHNELQDIYGREFGADGYEISVHANPAIDHEEVQGRQFNFEEYSKLNSGGFAKDYKGRVYTLDHDGKNGYRPISELNCYHYIFAIVLGVSNPTYSDNELQQIIDKNEKGFDFEGKHYSMYEGTQLQRQIETEIRKQKDIQTLAKESDNKELIAKSQKKITQLTHKYKELSDVSGLPTKMERMKVSGYKRVKVDIPKEENKLFSDIYIEGREYKYEDFVKFNANNINDNELDKIGKEYFNFKSNESLDKYVIQSGNMYETMQSNKVYKEEMYDIANKIEPLKKETPISFVAYTGINKGIDLTQSDFVISTSINEGTARLYKTLAGGEKKATVATIYIEKGANIISTYNTSVKRFNSQGEIIIPISEIKNLDKLDKDIYLLKKFTKKK